MVIREHVESLGFVNSSNYREQLRYEICPGVRIVFRACSGGWAEPEIWTGGNLIKEIPLKTEEQLKSLLIGLGKC